MNPPDVAARLDPAARQQLEALMRVRGVAWPTVGMCAVLVLGILASDTMALTGRIPLWLAAVCNSAVGYLAFSVVHDAIHRSVAAHRRLNDAIGQLAVLMVVPYTHLGLFRWGHSRHHRFAVGPQDPDRAFHGPWWQLPLRWAFIDLAYFLYAIRYGDAVSARFLRRSLGMFAVFLLLAAAIITAGHGRELFWLWFLPSRLVQILLGFGFFWLPHAPHDTPQAVSFTRASTVREGHEWLMDRALQYQNYHLVHHLFPAAPHYRNGRIWRLIRPALAGEVLAIQRGFAIRPEIRSG